MIELGVDLVEISRVRALARRNPKFLTRVFSAEEIAYCRGKKDPWPHFAVRFAAKEAVYKALADRSVPLTAISVAHGADGRPQARVRGRALRGLTLSLSHGESHAIAVAARK